MTTKNRPLSPHLQVYRPQITSVLSITHRLTGVVLALGALVLVYWINAAAYGPAAFDQVQSIFSHWFGQILLFGWTLCLFFHLCNGVRHLFWDAGVGLEMGQVRVSGWLVLFAAAGLAALSWLGGYGMLG